MGGEIGCYHASKIELIRLTMVAQGPQSQAIKNFLMMAKTDAKPARLEPPSAEDDAPFNPP